MSLKSLSVFSAFLLLFLVGLPFGLRAEVQIQSNTVWRRPKTISVGQQVWSITTSYQRSSRRFDASGSSEPLGQRYVRRLSWDQLMSAEGSVEGKAEIKDYMKRSGLSNDDTAAVANYDVDSSRTSFNLSWAYGLTSNWMIGFQAPLNIDEVRVREQINMNPSLGRGAGQKSQSILALKGTELNDKVRQLASRQLNNSGYDSIPDQSRSWNWGDIDLLSQYQLYNNSQWVVSSQQLVRFPTSANPDLGNYLRANNDEGQMDVGLSALAGYRTRRWSLFARAGYVVQWSDQARVRVPTRVSDDKSEVDSRIESTVKRDLGDFGWAASEVEYHLSSRLDLNLEYSFLRKQKDFYSGELSQDSAYQSMALGTDQTLHQTRFGFLCRLGNESSRSGIVNSWIAALDYTLPLMGENSIQASRARIEIINYF